MVTTDGSMATWIGTVAPNGTATAVGEVVECDPFDAAEAAVVTKASNLRRREFHTGRRLARAALAKLGCTPTSIIPDSMRVPRWPAGFMGSISHSRSLCVAHVGSPREFVGVGIDIEPDAPCPREIVDQISRPDENNSEESTIILARFVAKEAFYKAYFPVTRTCLNFKDVFVEFDLSKEKFVAVIVNGTKPSVNGQRFFEGHLTVINTHIIALLWI